jgi:hypothetical protein
MLSLLPFFLPNVLPLPTVVGQLPLPKAVSLVMPQSPASTPPNRSQQHPWQSAAPSPLRALPLLPNSSSLPPDQPVLLPSNGLNHNSAATVNRSLALPRKLSVGSRSLKPAPPLAAPNSPSAGPLQRSLLRPIIPSLQRRSTSIFDTTLPPVPTEAEIQLPIEVRPLPGTLDSVPVFNSNNPEIVSGEGILLSTFPAEEKAYPSAHLNFAFKDRFDIFTHHVTRASNSEQTRTLFQGLVLYNPTNHAVTLDVLSAATYLTRPDALFVELPAYVEDPNGSVYAGPGSRAVSDVLRGRRQGVWSTPVTVPPRSHYLLMNLPIPVGTVTPSSNARSTLARLRSSSPLYAANVAVYAPLDAEGKERIPSLEDYLELLYNGDLVRPRDLRPSPPGMRLSRYIYGRVSGVAKGSQWKAYVTDSSSSNFLTIPPVGQGLAYLISSLPRGTFGTGQEQSAPMLTRYPDAAYQAHGNYGIEYNLTLPLHNRSKQTQQVAVLMQTPIKENQRSPGLRFLNPPENRVFFRGALKLQYTDDRGQSQTRFVHLVQNRGDVGEPLLLLSLRPGEVRTVKIEFVYPPDATPPQVISIKTLDEFTAQSIQPVLGDRPRTNLFNSLVQPRTLAPLLGGRLDN